MTKYVNLRPARVPVFKFGVAIAFAMFSTLILWSKPSLASNSEMLIDDFSDQTLTSALGTKWRNVNDTVMGGVSSSSVTHHKSERHNCLHLAGDVRLENNGGFIQAALDLSVDGKLLDASAFTGIRLIALGNEETYSVHLRTPDNTRPWQSYRANFNAQAEPQTINIPFSSFKPYKTDVPLDNKNLRRIGIVGIGRAFQADLKICQISLYR
ncbi:MAG: CIA30 family protein [Rhizobiaceae bacterium]